MDISSIEKISPLIASGYILKDIEIVNNNKNRKVEKIYKNNNLKNDFKKQKYFNSHIDIYI